MFLDLRDQRFRDRAAVQPSFFREGGEGKGRKMAPTARSKSPVPQMKIDDRDSTGIPLKSSYPEGRLAFGIVCAVFASNRAASYHFATGC